MNWTDRVIDVGSGLVVALGHAVDDYILNALSWLGHATWQASLLIVLVLLLKGLFGRRISPAIHYFLWVPVLLRLMSPFLFNGSLSLYSLVSYVPGIGLIDRFDNGTSGLGGPFIYLLMLVWMAGVTVSLTHLTYRCWKFSRLLKQGVEMLDAPVQDLLEQCKQSLSINRSIRLIESRDLATPAITGLIRPVLILPEGLVNRISSRELRYIFLHELAHFKNGDLWVYWLAKIINVLHWFNPITRYAISCLLKDCEKACDARVLDVLEKGSERRAYGIALLRLFSELPENNEPAAAALFIFNGKRAIKQRIESIARFKPSLWQKRGIALLSVIPLAVVAISQPTSYCGFGSESEDCKSYCESEKPIPAAKPEICRKTSVQKF